MSNLKRVPPLCVCVKRNYQLVLVQAQWSESSWRSSLLDTPQLSSDKQVLLWLRERVAFPLAVAKEIRFFESSVLSRHLPVFPLLSPSGLPVRRIEVRLLLKRVVLRTPLGKPLKLLIVATLEVTGLTSQLSSSFAIVQDSLSLPAFCPSN